MALKLVASIQVALTVLFIGQTWLAGAAPDAEVPFPLLFSQSQIMQHRFHIVTESISEVNGYEKHEEFLDMESGKNTFITSDKNGRVVTHIDAKLDIIFRYKPYTCTSLKPNEVEHSGNEGIWTRTMSLRGADGKVGAPFNVYGVAAIWLNAGDMPKLYSDTSIIYSASKDIHRKAHKWTVKDENAQFLVHFYFIDNNSRAKDNKLTLEMIQIESMAESKIIRTLNILSLEYSINDEIYDSLLQIPVGYGCVDAELSARMEATMPWTSVNKIQVGPLLEKSHKLDLEVTSTKYDSDTQKRSSDTISVELANVFANHLQLLRQRDTKRDIKIISNFWYNVDYTVDLRRGTCKMANIDVKTEQGDYASLSFENGLKFILNPITMVELFVPNKNSFFVKKATKQGSRTLEYLYYEHQSTLWTETVSVARIIRVYTSPVDSNSSPTLESVTVLYFDRDDPSKIAQTFHFNVIELRKIEGALDISRTFDISEECYLNNEKMKQGRDYTWFELTYPVSTRHSEVLASRSMEFKQMVHNRFVDAGLSLFNSPRIELIFDTELIIRVLLLDIPSLTLLYEFHDNTICKIDKTKGDMEEVTVDLEHCADLCRLNKCTSMSFSETEHLCLLSNIQPIPKERNTNYKTYMKSLFKGETFDQMLNQRLHRVLSNLQHRNYDPIPLPRMPDELMYPRSQTGVDEPTFRELTDSYLEEVLKFLKESGQQMPELTLNVSIDDVLTILMPSHFEVEQDPLSEFSLTSDDSTEESDSLDQAAPAFHEGLSLYSYKIDLLNQVDQKNWRLFSGLNYDQCALACVDGRCSSFSYCVHRQECIITDVYSLSESAGKKLIKADSDCFIAQRDFLSKFNKFPDVFQPNIYKRSLSALNPSECAHSCMVESEFNCLAFDYCAPSLFSGHESQLGSCFLSEERRIYTGGEAGRSKAVVINDQGKKGSSKQATGCDHYSRSYLADFLRIEHRQIEDSEMQKLKTSSFEGRSVDRCAELCVNELFDCTAFQFCFDPKAEGAMQNCVMIESQPQVSDSADAQVILNERGGGQIVKAGKLFVTSENCHVFSLRRGSNEAHLRNLALNGMTNEEFESSKKARVSSGGLSIGGGILLYFSLTFVFAALGCGIVMAKHHNEYVRQRIERIQLLLGINII